MSNDNETVITLKEVYDLLITMKIELSSHPKQIEDHEKRIRNLELRVWTASGIFSVVTILLTQIISFMKG
jgi:hypothetical protein